MRVERSSDVASSDRGFNFRLDHLSVGLKQRTVRGAALTIASQSLRMLMHLGSTAVLARQLAPEDYGLVGMVSVVTGALMVFSNLGISSAIIQRPEIDNRQMSTLFWINFGLGAGLTLLTVAIAPALAWFYHDQRLVPLTVAMGFGFLISGVGVQHGALLRREMRFGVLAVIEIGSIVVAAATGILLASIRFGYWSLALMQLAALFTISGAAWTFCGWRPGWPCRAAGIGPMVAFGAHVTTFGALNFVVRNCDNMLIGWRWGAAELGQYSKAYQLSLFPLAQIIAPITNVAVPALSRLQHDPIRYRQYYLEAIRLIGYCTTPLVLFLGVCSREIVYLILGPQWSQAGHLFQLLILSSVGQPIASTTGWLFQSRDRARAMARWGLISGPIFVLSFIIGLPWGAEGVAISYIVAGWLLAYPCFVMAVRSTPVSMTDIGLACYRPLTVGLLAGIAMFVTRSTAAPGHGMLLTLVLTGSAGLIATLLVGCFWMAVREDFGGMIRILRNIARP
jgi:PST family polysaccharide transporter